MQASNYKENKLRWYPQQPQRFIFTNLSETCCETKRWKPFEHFEPVGTWPGPAPKIPPKPSPGPSLQPSPGPVEPDLALHQGFPRASPEPSPEPCWTWPGSAPKPPGTFSGTFSGTLLNLTCLCTKSQTLSGTFGTFSGTSLNLTRCLHQCTPELYSGLKTPSAYAVGEKLWTFALIHVG